MANEAMPNVPRVVPGSQPGTPVDYETAIAMRNEYEDEFRKRHDAFRQLRRYWQGDYWRLADKESHSIVSVFRDWTARASDVGPDVKLVFNVVQAVCNKYQTFLSPLPQVRVPVDPPESDTRRAQATKKQRYIYGCWNDQDLPMSRVFNLAAWYLPLMGDCFLGIHPDMDKGRPVPLLRSPECAYPIPGFDGSTEEAIIFSWKVKEDVVKRQYKDNYQTRDERKRSSVAPNLTRFRKTGEDDNPHIDVVEYSDRYQWTRWIDGEEVNGVYHNFGFNLYEHLKFINVPDDVWGHGAVEQVINLNEMGNALYSLLFEAVIENVFPRLVLEDASKAPEEIATGPGAVIPLNPGGNAYFLNPPVAALPVQEQFLGVNSQNIKEMAGMNNANMGEIDASIITGKAINELQGAGAGSMVEMVQGVGIGLGVESWNEKAIILGQTMFRDDRIHLHGREIDGLSIRPRDFAMSIKGSELVGSPRNELVFSPALSMHEKIVMGLQAAGGGLVSKKWQREQMGIPDNEAMEEEIFQEAVTEAVLNGMLQTFTQQPDETQVEKVEADAFGLLMGKTQQPAGGANEPHPLTQMGQPPMQLLQGGQQPGQQPPVGPQSLEPRNQAGVNGVG
jgi:hypothetical protein